MIPTNNRFRLNHAGDRHANNAIWRIVITRLGQHEPRTVAYMNRRMRRASRSATSSAVSSVTSPARSSGRCHADQNAVTGLAHELPDTSGLSFERHAVPPPHTTAGPWPDKSLPSPEWPITGLPETPATTPLTTHRSVDRHRRSRRTGPADGTSARLIDTLRITAAWRAPNDATERRRAISRATRT